MGKKLIIKGADFSANAIDSQGFDALEWFTNAIDSVARNIPVGYILGLNNQLNTPKTDTGMRHPATSAKANLFYGPFNSPGFSSPRFLTPSMLSMKTLADNGITAIKLTPKKVDIAAVAYSDTPASSSTNPFNPGVWNYNTDLSQKTIPITTNTYLLLQVKSLTDDPAIRQSSVADWFDISFA